MGPIQKVDLQYYQGWINPVIHNLEERAKVWRLDPEKGGASCCIGDIGTHAFDMLEYVTGMEVKQLLADLNTLYDNNPLDVDGTVLVRMSEHCKGVIRASQIATAEENNFSVQIYGSKGSLKWQQESPNRLIYLTEDKPMQVLKPSHDYLSEFAKESSKIPPVIQKVFLIRWEIFTTVLPKLYEKKNTMKEPTQHYMKGFEECSS